MLRALFELMLDLISSKREIKFAALYKTIF